jgi:hypothetical protein
MNKVILALGLLTVACPPAHADTVKEADVDNLHRYKAVCTFNVAADFAYVAISVPATGTKRIFLEDVTINSTVATTAQFNWGGTAPSATATTSIKKNTTESSQATAYCGATSAGAGTYTVDMAVPDASRDTFFDLSGEVFPKKTANTLLIKIGSVTATGKVVIHWGESR